MHLRQTDGTHREASKGCGYVPVFAENSPNDRENLSKTIN
jgi:hypothetical protein